MKGCLGAGGWLLLVGVVVSVHYYATRCYR